MTENMKSLVAMFARPSMRKNPHAWCTLFTVYDYSIPVARNGGVYMRITYRSQTVGLTPAWLNG